MSTSTDNKERNLRVSADCLEQLKKLKAKVDKLREKDSGIPSNLSMCGVIYWMLTQVAERNE